MIRNMKKQYVLEVLPKTVQERQDFKTSMISLKPLLGKTDDDKSIHIVCALEGDNIWMITAY
jgi:hypothetical protein